MILGRQPAIGLAELESLYGAELLQYLGTNTALLDMPTSSIDFNRLGGTMKLGQVLKIVKKESLDKELRELIKQIELPKNSKINIGVSAYNLDFSVGFLQAMAFSVKKTLKQRGINARVVPNRSQTLNTAQVLHNKLAGKSGIELILAAYGSDIIVVRTTNVQNITDYTARDRLRPKRDTYVGMLPPKLAQIIVNLATPKLTPTGTVVLDPFCGTGVILQEALLIGFDTYGSDLNERMINYSKTNIAWAKEKYHFAGNIKIEAGDARLHQWQQPINVVASETYLGVPLTTVPVGDKIQTIINSLDKLHKEVLINIYPQLKPGTRLCLAVPAWYVKGQFLHLPTLDQLTNLGYNRVTFEHIVNPDDLIYHRPGQLVARELVTMLRN